MTFLLDSKKTFKVIKACCKMIFLWPTDFSKSNKLESFMYEIKWWVVLINVIGLLIPLILGVYHFRDEMATMVKSLSELMVLLDVLCNLLLCRMKESHLKMVFFEIENFIMNAGAKEYLVIQKYVNRHQYLYTYICMSCILTAVIFNCAPFFTGNILPADAWYPFTVDSQGIRCVIYILQSVIIFQVGLNIFADIMIATLLWYATARLELLAFELMQINSIQDICHSIRKHQHLALFTQNVNNIVQFMLLKVHGFVAIAIIFGGFTLIHHEPLAITFQFIMFVIGGCCKLYVSARPADDLKTMSVSISMSVYDSKWIKKTKEMRNILFILIQRSHKPMVISFSGLVSAFCLEQYANFLSVVLSYFIKLSAIIE